MDLQEIHRKTQLPLRKLRYVLDHQVLPGAKVETDPQRWGHPRSFTEFEGFSIAVAATLLEGGLRRELVAEFLGKMVSLPWGKTVRNRNLGPLFAAFQGREKPCLAEIADGKYLAIRIGTNRRVWIELQSSSEAPAEYQPDVLITIDLARIRNAILSK